MSASRVSSETPRQPVSSLDQRVTQWMSTVTDSAGKAISSDQLHRWLSPSSVVTVNSQASSGMRGVGPAERTGKSLVRYWPGGSCRLVSRLRLWKPLLTVLIAPSFKDQPGIHLRVVAIVVSLALPEPKQWLAHARVSTSARLAASRTHSGGVEQLRHSPQVRVPSRCRGGSVAGPGRRG